MSTTTPLTLLVLTTTAKIAFGIFFTAGATFIHSNQADEAVDFCADIGKDSWSEGFFCCVEFTRGLLITGAIFFFFSILLEAFGPNKILIGGGTIVPTMFHALGSLFLIVSSMYPILVLRENLIDFVFDHPDFDAGFWIAGGLITALGQAYLAFILRSEGLFIGVTYFIASLGSFLFMVTGIMMTDDVAEEYLQTHDELELMDLIDGLMISGSVFYVIHGILYPIATYKKIKDLTFNQENPAVTVTNPNIYKEKPDDVGNEEEC